MDHVFVKQGLLDSPGFVYGKAKIRSGRSPNVRVRRVASGRWEDLPAFSASLTRASLQHRIVSEQEALSGIGTYVGCCVCVSRVSDHSARAWAYGVVVGYEWKTEASSSILYVDFGDKTDVVLFDGSALQDLAMVTFALRPCSGRPVADVMPGEMREINKAAYEAFMGVSGQAIRDSTRIRGDVQADPLDETQRVPLYEFTAGRVALLPIKHILDFGFYKDGHRSVPLGLSLGNTIFDYEPNSAQQPPAMSSTEEAAVSPADRGSIAQDQEAAVTREAAAPRTSVLSDSDSDAAVASNIAFSGGNHDGPARSKRRRESGSRSTSRPEGGADSRHAILDEYEEFLAFKRSRLHDTADVVRFQEPRDVVKAPFRPSALQQTIHRVLVSGKYCMMNPLLFLETTQTEVEGMPIIAHPAVLRALYAWEFGSYGLSVMHFARRRHCDRRDAERLYNFGDFTAKNKLPVATKPFDITDIVAALDMLAKIVRKVYKAVACDVVDAATTFAHLLSEDVSVLPPAALVAIVYWIDKRFQKARAAFASSDLTAVNAVLLEFQPNSGSHQRLLNIMIEQRINTHVDARLGQALQQPQPSSASAAEVGNSRAQTRKSVPASVLNALPIQDGKQLCMRFLSRVGCHSKGAACFTSDRGHFKPQRLPTVVKTWISKNYGGLRAEYSEL